MDLSHNSRDKNKEPKIESLTEVLIPFGKPVTYKKDEVIFSEGGKADFLLIIQQGVLKTYRFVNDKEVVLGFTFPGDLETSPVAFISNRPSQETIQATSDAKAIRVSRTEFFEALGSQNLKEDPLQSILLRYIEVLIKRHLDLKAYTAEENYIKLLMKQPKLVHQIPLKDIASFLGISQERLSRIRKKHELT